MARYKRAKSKAVEATFAPANYGYLPNRLTPFGGSDPWLQYIRAPVKTFARTRSLPFRTGKIFRP